MKQIIISSLVICLLFSEINAQKISNIQALQQDNFAVINYELYCDEAAIISLFYSEDNGATFKGPLKSVSGDVGENVKSGNKKIVWDVLSEKDLLFKSDIIFRIYAEQKFGKFTDFRDDYTYKTVKIGDKIWMAENLRYSSENIRSVNSLYGGYYSYTTGINAVCPSGWKLPSQSDFENLLESIKPYGSSDAEVLLKDGATGFNAILSGGTSGLSLSPTLGGVEVWTDFWSSTVCNECHANLLFVKVLHVNKTNTSFGDKLNQTLGSIRCLKNTGSSNYEKYDSPPSSFAISKDNVSIFLIPVEVYIKKYVEQKISIWQQKGEFEKTSDFQKRVNETTRDQKVKQITNEALKNMKSEYTNSINWNNFILSQYDADNETYLVQSNEFGKLAIPVPVSDAQSFKQNWSSLKFSGQDYYVSNNKLVLAKLVISNPSNAKKYTYDSKQPTTYAANNITYNFKPIKVSVQEENVINNSKVTESKTIVGVAEVDINVPLNPQLNDKTFAVIIANENYTKEVKVQFALNDGRVFKEYCEKTLGIPKNNIHFSQDATFGAMKSEIKWISDVAQAYTGQAKIIFYYAGHGMPNESDKSAYLLPVDGFSSDYETAIKLDDLYNKLNTNPTQSITVILDACFSGSVRDNGMLANARGVKVRPKTDMLKGKMVVISAASGDETAYPFKEKQHGLFTYFLLKKLQETKGNIDYQTLTNYIIEKVKQQSIVVNQKSQTPQVIVSPEIQSSWQIMKIR